MSIQVSKLPSLLMARSSPFDASTVILAVMETSDIWWERGGINKVRRDYDNCMTESNSSVLFGRYVVTKISGMTQNCQCQKK
jgi:hypothetical protein